MAASDRARSSHADAASLPVPSWAEPVGSDGSSTTRYPRVMFSTVISRSGSTARHRLSRRVWSRSTLSRVANSAAARSSSSRPPSASEVASSSSTRRTGSVTEPGTPAASRGRSASGHSMVTATGLEMSGGTAGLPGTPNTGSRKRASSRRAAPPYSGVPLTFTISGYTPGSVMSRDTSVSERSGSDSVNCLLCPSSRRPATVSNMPTVSYRDWSRVSDVRRPSLLATAGARCMRTLTSRTVRSPMFFTEPVTVTNGSLVVVTVDGVTLSMCSSRNSGSSSTVWVPALSGGTGSWAVATTVLVGARTTASAVNVTAPTRRKAILIRRLAPSGASGRVRSGRSSSWRSSHRRFLRVSVRLRRPGVIPARRAAPTLPR